MTVTALHSRRTAAPPAPRPASTPTVTVTVDIAVAGDTLTPQAHRLLELVRELVTDGDAAVRAPVTLLPPPPDPADPSALRIRVASRQVLRGEEVLPLTRLEFDLLLFLARHPRRVFSRQHLLASVWGYEHAVARTVDVHVRRLRLKIGPEPLLTTVHGVGYRLADDAVVVVDPHA